MLADYVMKSIDSLFSDKLFPSGHSQLHKAPPASFCPKRSFNKQTIKSNLANIIRRDGNSRSPLGNKEKSPSPIARSPLRSILETNRAEKIKSVVKRSEMRESSPYHKIERDLCRNKGSQGDLYSCQDSSNKENSMIRYYRQERKSFQKHKACEKSNQLGNSRIFSKKSKVGRGSSGSSFR